tara:strand:+ start:510 stop:725 length:216 start_codon:yes stop_codon:yes gene_type:complete
MNTAEFELRMQRNAHLIACDWVMFPDSPLSDSKKSEWATYRQALRDLPANSNPALDENGNLTGVEWPTKPE